MRVGGVAGRWGERATPERSRPAWADAQAATAAYAPPSRTWTRRGTPASASVIELSGKLVSIPLPGYCCYWSLVFWHRSMLWIAGERSALHPLPWLILAGALGLTPRTNRGTTACAAATPTTPCISSVTLPTPLSWGPPTCRALTMPPCSGCAADARMRRGDEAREQHVGTTLVVVALAALIF